MSLPWNHSPLVDPSMIVYPYKYWEGVSKTKSTKPNLGIIVTRFLETSINIYVDTNCRWFIILLPVSQVRIPCQSTFHTPVTRWREKTSTTNKLPNPHWTLIYSKEEVTSLSQVFSFKLTLMSVIIDPTFRVDNCTRLKVTMLVGRTKRDSNDTTPSALLTPW